MKKNASSGITAGNIPSFAGSLLPLTIPQKNVWYEGLRSGRAVYNYRYLFDITGLLDATRLEKAIRQVTARYDAFRTTLVEKDWVPCQVIGLVSRQGTAQLECIDGTEEEMVTLLQTGQHERLAIDYQDPCRFLLIRYAPHRHCLLFAYHHILLDGNALKSVFAAISAAYNHQDTGLMTAAPDLPGIADLAAWEAAIPAGKAENGLAYWKNYLGNSLLHLELPVLKKSPAGEPGACMLTSELPVLLSQQIRQLAKEKQTTVFRILFAAFSILLYRITREEDFVLCYYADIRPALLKKAVGHYVGVQPCRFRIRENDLFNTVLNRLDREFEEQRSQDTLPYALCTGSRERLSYSNIAFGKTVSGRHHLHLEGADIRSCLYKGIPGEHDLLLMYDEDEAAIRLRAEYWLPLEGGVITALLAQYRALLASVVQQEAGTVGMLPLLMLEERERILTEWSRSPVNRHHAGTVAQWFEAQVQRTPDAPALVYGNSLLTYHALNEQADGLSKYLIGLGAGPEIPIAFCLEQPVARIVTMLAIVRSGAAYLPLDTHYPPQRCSFILQDTAAPVLVTTTALKDRFSQFNGYVLVLDDEREMAAIDAQVAEAPSPGPSPGNLAYVLYTSGTTGQPKGVMIEHRALSNFTGEYRELLEVDPSSRVLQFASISFDMAAIDIWSCLSGGACLYLYPDNRLTGMLLYDFIKTNRITIASLPPAVLATLPDPDDDCTAHLKTVLVGGEVTPEQVIYRWKDRVRLINGYGPTETTVCVNRFRITGNHPPATIGQPIANTSFYVLDAYGQPAPPCMTGELYIGGVQLARGYLNRPALTAERFIENPFASPAGKALGQDRLYRTGDLVRYLPDGNIEYLGRYDQQVKIRGYRIELEEIEQVLVQQPNIRQAVAHVWADGDKKKIVVYLVHQAGKPHGQTAIEAVEHIRQALKEVLPAYMIPAAFVWLESIPLSMSGKTDRKALPPPEQEPAQPASPLEQPGNEYESTIAAIWKEVLQKEIVGVKDNFFDLGGHSLLVTEVYSKLPEPYRQRLSLPDLFRYHTITALARRLHDN